MCSSPRIVTPPAPKMPTMATKDDAPKPTLFSQTASWLANYAIGGMKNKDTVQTKGLNQYKIGNYNQP